VCSTIVGMPRRADGPTLDEIRFGLDSWVVAARVLEDMGVPRRTIHHRCRPGGPWVRLLPGVVMVRSGPVHRDDRRRAALAYAGPGALLTGSDALEVAGLRRIPTPSGAVHVLVPADRRRLGAGRVLAERTERLPAMQARGGLPIAPVTRASLDFCRRSGDRDQVRAVLAEVVQTGRATPAALRAELEAGSGRGSSLPRNVLRELSAGVRSVAEAKAREVLGSTGLPEPLWNARLVDGRGLHVATVDAWFDEVGLAWEIDSREFHYAAEDYEHTVERHSRLTAASVIVVHTLPQTLRKRGAEVVAEIRRAYEHAALRPRPPLTALPQRR